LGSARYGHQEKHFLSTKSHEENTKGRTEDFIFLRETSCDFVEKHFLESHGRLAVATRAWAVAISRRGSQACSVLRGSSAEEETTSSFRSHPMQGE
jgi:hypothetical protein